MNIYKEKEICCGCTACMNACPQKAITMQSDGEGFLYPQVDKNLCISCGICKKVCPFQKEISLNQDTLIFAAKHIDPDVVADSTSGGVFTALSDYILKKNGAVYGVAFGDGFRVCHQKASSAKQRDTFRGSKYVQSDLGYIFQDINIELKRGTNVLFTGTPCQNAGLRSYLEQVHADCYNLYLCDNVCHGVPSPLIWREYVEFLENKFKDEMQLFSFRSKKYGWKSMKTHAKFTNGIHDKECNMQYSFMDLFLSLYLTRPSCFNCKFTSFNRPSDITLADFWNIEYSKPYMDDDKGVSLVLVNTIKGQNLFNKIRDNLICEESNKIDCWQPHLEYPCAKPKGREKFWREYHEKGASYVIKKYGRGTFSSRMKKELTPLLRKTGLYIVAGKVYRRLFIKGSSQNDRHK